MQIAPQLTDVVDPDLIADRLDDVEVGMGAATDAAGVADQLGRKRERCGSLADSRRAVEEVRVRGSLRDRGAKQTLRLGLLRKALEGVHGSAPQSRPAAASRRR